MRAGTVTVTVAVAEGGTGGTGGTLTASGGTFVSLLDRHFCMF